MATKTRSARSSRRGSDGKLRRKVGGRSDAKPFYFPKTVSESEVEDRVAKIKKVYETFGGWNELSTFIAENIRIATIPIPLPPMDRDFRMFSKSSGRADWGDWREYLVQTLPFLPWATLAETEMNPIVREALESDAERDLGVAAERLSQFKSQTASQVRAIPGRLHDALKAYEADVLETDSENFDRQSKVKQLIVRHPDQPLATLGLDSCRVMIDYWRNRPPRHDGKGNYTDERSRKQRLELDRFFDWLHLGSKLQWRKPTDFEFLAREVKSNKGNSKSILDSQMKVFSIEELATLVRHAGMPEKLWIIWCLNNSQGAAEVGRVQWEDIFLDQDHPWKSEGFKIGSGGNWTGFLRPKTDVLGWWSLWPETVELLVQWKLKCKEISGRDVQPSETVIIRDSGSPLYGTAKNAQAGFYNQFTRLKNYCKRTGHPVTNLPPGTLRNQFADWCGGDEADATVASVALAHGIPHKNDKLLYKHYSNRPWKRLFQKQMEYRTYCRPVLEAVYQSPPLPPKMRDFYELWPKLTGKKSKRVNEAAKTLRLSNDTIYRYLEKLPLDEQSDD